MKQKNIMKPTNIMKPKKKKSGLALLVCILLFAMVGCEMPNIAEFSDFTNTIKGQLVGQNFDIYMYDDAGSKTLEVSGTKVGVGILENSANYQIEDTGFKSEVLEITINGKQILQVGNTCVFAEKGLDIITDFNMPEKIEVNSGGGYMSFDRLLNDYRNSIGKSKVIMISSQEGLPIGVYQGDSVYVTIPSDLPKMTRLNIDGKSLYIHRANYTIIDSDLIK